MSSQTTLTRRTVLKSSAFGLLSISIPKLFHSNRHGDVATPFQEQVFPHNRYPAIPLEIASEVVGVSHFDLDRLKQLVDPRPELANATWDWAFGDWESAIGAASHTGRKDIAEYLISKGAMPTIFTYAMFGAYDTVKSMIETYPGIQKNLGPHGFSLLHHARQAVEVEGNDKSKAEKLIEYLEKLGDADGKKYLTVEEEEKQKYVGDYKYGDGNDDGFTVKINMRKLISLGKLGKNRGALYKIGENKFTYNGAPSVIVSFEYEVGKVVGLIVSEPGLQVTARKI